MPPASPRPSWSTPRPSRGPEPVNLAALHRSAALRHAGRPALTDPSGTLDHAGLAERAARIGGGLAALGLRRGDRVGLWMENGAAFLEVLLGAWTAGLCVVPVNARLHPRELGLLLEDCGARLLFTTPSLLPDAEGVRAASLERIVCAPGADYDRLCAGDPLACAACAPDDLAWIFYTSGTTGRSKGAMLSHRNLLAATLAYYADIEPVGPSDTKLHAAPLSHASGLYGLPFLLKGAHSVVLTGFEPRAVADALRRLPRVTMFAAPTMLTRLVDAAADVDLDPGNLRTLYYGGGPMYVADLERARAVFGPRLYQVYGQGESPMTITGLDHHDHQDPGLLPTCGAARTGVSLRVVDEDGRDVAPGEAGEVVTRNETVMSGYWNAPEATAAALRDGWLWTGDVGALDARGVLTLSDRSKDMIISGGSNIYPREVEEVLLRHPGVLEASVVGRPHAEWGEEVVAFVVPRAGAVLEPSVLDRLCLDHIARFKRPKAYRLVEALPKNGHGKVLKTALRARLADEAAS